jgi:hypothetical protein
MSVRLFAALAGALLMAQPAAAAEPPAGETTVEGVVITARPAVPSDQALDAFVSDVSVRSPTGRLARWDRKICPGVTGVRPDYAQMMIDRIAQTAFQVGLQIGEPGCKSNMIIVATDDSPTLVQGVVKDYPDAFAKFEDGTSRGRPALEAFVASPLPVRWWHVTRNVGADGQAYDRGQAIKVRGVGRIRSTTRDDFDRVIIIVDVKRTGVLRWQALSDYVAMVGLAQIDAGADTKGVPTILNMFADGPAGAAAFDGLTDWDVAYLKGLYAARRDSPRGRRQERDVVHTMAEELKTPPPADR